MGYHSSDYDHDWAIGVAELARTTDLYNTAYSGTGLRSGCYKVDLTSIDGFAPDTYRDPSLPVELSSYHSADFNRDGRIDDAELARVTHLYDTEVDSVRTGQYHVSPDSVDGFDQGYDSVLLSSYQFDEDHPPVISTTNDLSQGSYVYDYILRAKFIDGSSTGFQSTASLNNNGLALEVLPPPGVYTVTLYWVVYRRFGISGDYNNDGIVSVSDVAAIGQIASGALPQPTGELLVRCDCAPRPLGNGGPIGITDWTQAGRYQSGADPITPINGIGTVLADGTVAIVGEGTNVTVTISPAAASGDQTRCAKCEGIDSTVPVLEDQGQCNPPPVTRTCNAPDIPETACNNEVYVTQYNPDATPRFSVVASLKDQSCQDILDESDQAILTVIQ